MRGERRYRNAAKQYMLKFKKYIPIIFAVFFAMLFAFVFSVAVSRDDSDVQKDTGVQLEATNVNSGESFSEKMCFSTEAAIYDTDVVPNITIVPSASVVETSVQSTVDIVVSAESSQISYEQIASPAPEVHKSYIDINNYTPYISYNGLSESACRIIEQIFNIISKHSTDISDCDNHRVYEDRECCCFEYQDDASKDVCAEVRSFFVLYCGDFSIQKDIFTRLQDSRNNISTFHMPLDMVDQIKQKRNIYVDRVESVLGSFCEGTVEEKINAFGHYIVSNSVYKRDMACVDDFWLRGRANCNVYAMVLREFAERIGVPCDVVVGYTASGEYHAWNRITLPDGLYRYYDLSFYESTRNAKYFNSDKNPHNQVYINRYSAR